VTQRLLLVVVVAGATALGCACRQPTPSPTVAAAAPAAAPSTAPGGLGGGPAGQTVARQYLVTVAAGAGEPAVREVLAPLGLTAVKPIGNDTFLITLGEDPGLARVEALGKQDARIRAVQPNFVYRAN
jgi:hypothetical protein